VIVDIGPCGISYCFTVQHDAAVVTEAQVIRTVSIPDPLGDVLPDADLFPVRKMADSSADIIFHLRV
jgi:hypothetical protein